MYRFCVGIVRYVWLCMLVFKGEAVERVETYKDLGELFDSELNWKENINSVLKKK